MARPALLTISATHKEQSTDVLVVWGNVYLKFTLLYLFSYCIKCAVGGKTATECGLQCFSAAKPIQSFSFYRTCCLHIRFDLPCWCHSAPASPIFVIECTYPLLDSKRQLRQSFHLPISLNSRLYPPPSSSSSSSSFLFGHSSESENARGADQWETDVWSCIDGSSSCPARLPASPSILWCVPWTFSITSSCEPYEEHQREAEREREGSEEMWKADAAVC